MTKLLVSVRNAVEAQIALDQGADLIDVKEPARGSLGAADVTTIEAVVRQIAGRLPISAALGELLTASSLPASLAGQLGYAKFGLADCANHADWPRRWQQAIDRLPVGIMPVGVAYADWKTARAPSPREVVMHAQQLGCRAILFDTYDKSQGPLFNHVALPDLEELLRGARSAGLACVVAGGLGPAEIRDVLPLAPDYVAVRGAACVGDRSGRLDAGRVRRLTGLVRQSARRAIAERT
jgi:hypothetical protein